MHSWRRSQEEVAGAISGERGGHETLLFRETWNVLEVERLRSIEIPIVMCGAVETRCFQYLFKCLFKMV